MWWCGEPGLKCQCRAPGMAAMFRWRSRPEAGTVDLTGLVVIARSEPETAAMLQVAQHFKPHVWVNAHSGMEALFMPCAPRPCA